MSRGGVLKPISDKAVPRFGFGIVYKNFSYIWNSDTKISELVNYDTWRFMCSPTDDAKLAMYRSDVFTSKEEATDAMTKFIATNTHIMWCMCVYGQCICK